ncbi:MAG: reprolysin-like metallopeptidase [Anaerolineae bacterium]
MNKFNTLILSTLFLAASLVFSPQPTTQLVEANQHSLWRDVSLNSSARSVNQPLLPQRYRLVRADLAQLQALLMSAPDSRAHASALQLELPLSSGGFGLFDIQSAPIMELELAAKFPQLQTFIAQGVDDPTATGRLDLTPQGFHAYIQTADGDIFIDPYQNGDAEHYIVYAKTAATRLPSQTLERAPESTFMHFNPFVGRSIQANLSVGDIKRTFQLAMSATGEFTEAQCSQPGAECLTAQQSIDTAMAAIVTGINRVTQIYERDLSISFILVNGNEQLVFADSTSDPYSDADDIEVTLDEAPGVIDGIIPIDNYDIGHVVSSGANVGGGLAGAFTCESNDHFDKMTGATALEDPVGDPFWVDYVAHEIGHQFFADHSYNASAGGGCTTRSGTVPYEPASGSTIMSYVGICEGQDLQDRADAMFNAGAYHEMITHVTTGFGSTCANETATGNSAPSVNAGSNQTIPKETPFRLTASISDAEQPSSALTVSWEQFSIGAQWPFDSVLPNTDQQDGNVRPILRVLPPSINPVRTVPTLANILDGSYQNSGEDLPSIDQTITFRATVRDNAAGSGGVASSDMQLQVVESAGPFRITSHASNTTLDGQDMTMVSWDVANTDQAPVSCPSVNISLSLDGGVSFNTNLATNTPNDGNQMVTIPGTVTPSNQGRIQVKCSNNIFFDISKANLTITNSEPVEFTDFILLPLIGR